MGIRTIQNRDYDGIPVGIVVRKSIGKTLTYRVRRGKGFYNAIAGETYQDRYTYFAPSSITNPESEPYRAQWKAAVSKWQTGLTAAERKSYNVKATHGLQMSGYNLFMRLCMKGEIDMYVDRGDPAAYDFAIGDLTIDGAWHDLDLSSIIPIAAKGVYLMGMVEGANVNWNIMFRKKGNTNAINHEMFSTLRAGIERHRSGVIAVGTDRKIEYMADNQAWTTLSLVVRGWWT